MPKIEELVFNSKSIGFSEITYSSKALISGLAQEKILL
jgi:hypothetical protein